MDAIGLIVNGGAAALTVGRNLDACESGGPRSECVDEFVMRADLATCLRSFATPQLARAAQAVNTPSRTTTARRLDDDSRDAGWGYSETIGGPMAIVDRARAAVESLSSEVIYIGSRSAYRD